MTRLPTSRVVPFIVLALAAGVPAATAAPAAAATATYTITDLGSLGFGVSDGLAINASDEVTGYSYLSKEIPAPCDGAARPGRDSPPKKRCFTHPFHAFVYRNGAMTDLGTLGGDYSQGLAINRSGEVVGLADNKEETNSSFLWNGTTMHTLSGLEAFGINDSGQIAGSCGLRACLDVNGTVTQLPAPGDFTSTGCGAVAINDNGQAVGSCDDTDSLVHAVLWQHGTATDLGARFGPQASAAAINNRGQVVGWAQNGGGEDYGMLWSHGKFTLLGANFFPAAINDHGVIVGGNQIYSGGALEDLDNLIPARSHYQIDYATAINDNGQIVACAYDTATNQEHALLLTPH